MKTEIKKTCIICGKEFIVYNNYKKYTCSDNCKKQHAVNTTRNIQLRNNKLKDNSYRICSFCGIEFIPKKINQVTCGKKECVIGNKRNKREVFENTIKSILNSIREIDESFYNLSKENKEIIRRIKIENGENISRFNSGWESRGW